MIPLTVLTANISVIHSRRSDNPTASARCTTPYWPPPSTLRNDRFCRGKVNRSGFCWWTMFWSCISVVLKKNQLAFFSVFFFFFFFFGYLFQLRNWCFRQQNSNNQGRSQMGDWVSWVKLWLESKPPNTEWSVNGPAFLPCLVTLLMTASICKHNDISNSVLRVRAFFFIRLFGFATFTATLKLVSRVGLP